MERSADTITVMQNGVYTACEPCKAHPEWPPLWQVRAGEIVENQETHTIYFRNAYLDAFGIPVLYMPYFSTADPTVTRQSGFLSPSYVSESYLGLGVTIPYFFDLAPNYDLTVSPSFYTMQGPLMDVEWRHRLENGSYDIRLSGIDELQPGKFLPQPYGAGNQNFRGSAESAGKFYLNQNWTVGWDLDPAQRSLLSQRLSAAGAGSDAIFLPGRGQPDLSARSGRSELLRSLGLRVPADDRVPRSSPRADRGSDLRLSSHLRARRRPLGWSAAKSRSS